MLVGRINKKHAHWAHFGGRLLNQPVDAVASGEDPRLAEDGAAAPVAVVVHHGDLERRGPGPSRPWSGWRWSRFLCELHGVVVVTW